MTRPKTKILVDGGDPQETRRVKELLGFVDGQTTNPSLIATNPHIRELIASGHKLSKKEEMDEYRKIVQTISPLVGDAGVSVEVFSDQRTTAQEMLDQGREMFSWIPNAYIKYPCTAEGLRAAQMSVRQGMRVNMTLCFSQQQAAAVYAATKGTKEPVYVSPFVGRLDDIGQNGMDVVRNIKRMFLKGDGHVLVLAASIRSLEHLLYCFVLATELATVPAKILEQWASKNFPMPDKQFQYRGDGKPIPYEELDLEQAWETFDIQHELTRKGIEKFAADYRATLSRPAPCKGPAMKNGRCRMHGGASTGPRTPQGLACTRRANWKHGLYSTEATTERRNLRQLLRGYRWETLAKLSKTIAVHGVD